MAPIIAKEKQGVFAAPRDGSPIKVGVSEKFQGDLLVVGIWERSKGEGDGKKGVEGIVGVFGEEIAGVVGDVIEEEGIDGKSGSVSCMVRLGKGGIKRLVVCGMGKKKEGEEGKEEKGVKGVVGVGVDKIKGMKGEGKLGIWIEGGWKKEWIQGATECCLLNGWSDKRFKGSMEEEEENGEKKKEEDKKEVKEVVFVGAKEEGSKGIEKGRAIAMGIVTTKEVINAPANVLTPTSMAECAKMVADEEGLEFKVLEKGDCEKLMMYSYLSVNEGSTRPLKFIHMTYKPSGTAKKKVVIVGKTVCHDTGGYNLKAGAGSGIASMKYDMGGGGTTLGAAKAIGKIKPEGVEVHFIMPACENMISGTATHPGDIVTASNGKTIEVANTDAEGRLTLADALVYAEKIGDVDYIIDLATLTGACIVALGNGYAGMWTNNEKMTELLEKSSKKVGDKLWHMPLPDEYMDQIKSKIADLKNTGGRPAGSITAALFLKQFVKKTAWAHLDIAGVAWSDKKGGPTGWGVRTLVDFAECAGKDE